MDFVDVGFFGGEVDVWDDLFPYISQEDIVDEIADHGVFVGGGGAV